MIDHSDGWHVTLLKRMANPFPDIRPSVLSAECYAGLDRLRSFRHRETNSYGIDPDPIIVLERAGEAITTFRLFESELRQFARRLGFDPTV